jgi:hypothetical protein
MDNCQILADFGTAMLSVILYWLKVAVVYAKSLASGPCIYLRLFGDYVILSVAD